MYSIIVPVNRFARSFARPVRLQEGCEADTTGNAITVQARGAVIEGLAAMHEPPPGAGPAFRIDDVTPRRRVA